MSGTVTDSALVAAATSTSPYATPTVPLNDALLQVPAGLSDEMYAKVSGPEIATVTTKTVNGTGVFDVIMASLSNHLKAEYEKDRITGSEYTKAYTEMTQMALNSAIQFALGKEQAFWAAQRAQIDAVNGRVELEQNRVLLNKAQFEAMAAQFTLAQIMPKQRDILTAELAGKNLDNSIKSYTLDNLLPQQVAAETARVAGILEDTAGKLYTRTNILPKQAEMLTWQITNLQEDLSGKTYSRVYILPAQQALLTEQGNVQRAQTTEYRADGTLITGVAAAQKALYNQQVTSYQRDSEVKAAKLFTDAWITQKTLDEGLAPPIALNNESVHAVLTKIRVENGMT